MNNIRSAEQTICSLSGCWGGQAPSTESVWEPTGSQFLPLTVETFTIRHTVWLISMMKALYRAHRLCHGMILGDGWASFLIVLGSFFAFRFDKKGKWPWVTIVSGQNPLEQGRTFPSWPDRPQLLVFPVSCYRSCPILGFPFPLYCFLPLPSLFLSFSLFFVFFLYSLTFLFLCTAFQISQTPSRSCSCSRKWLRLASRDHNYCYCYFLTETVFGAPVDGNLSSCCQNLIKKHREFSLSNSLPFALVLSP